VTTSLATALSLDVGYRLVRRLALILGGKKDRRAVAFPDVIALTVARRRVVNLKEELQQPAIADLRGSNVISIASACVP